MVLVLYTTPDPIIDERLERKILSIVDLALEKTGFEGYALIHEDHITVMLEPGNTPDTEAMMNFLKALEEDPNYEKYRNLISITT